MTEPSNVFRPPNLRWTAASLCALTPVELRQLRENAERVGAEDVVRLCEEALATRPQAGGKSTPPAKRLQKLIARRTAFQMRGVQLHAGMSSWSGVRMEDGMVVFSLWAEDVQRAEGGCSYLLWAPNDSGARPWSDSAGGKERLQHCRLAHERGCAEGLLVYGERQLGRLPEDRAASIAGVDPEVVIALQVVQCGESFWAVWGGRVAGGLNR